MKKAKGAKKGRGKRYDCVRGIRHRERWRRKWGGLVKERLGWGKDQRQRT